MSLRCCASLLTRFKHLPQIKQCLYSSQHIFQLNRQPNQLICRNYCSPKGEVRILDGDDLIDTFLGAKTGINADFFH